jgi:hypothetical protein
MKVLLIDIDSKIPNLALMKLSKWHKQQGDRVFLNRCGFPDITYVSCIFRQNAGKTTFYPDAKIGGTGISLNTALPDAIEHIMPDYDLYGCDFSIGFASRGCIRSCEFCVVPQKEGSIRDNAPLSEFLGPRHRKIMLLDNNLLAAPSARDVLHELAERRLLVNFNQGLDIRLVTDEFAELLAACDYRSRKFIDPRLYFAFDDPRIEDAVIHGLERVIAAGIKAYQIMVYILVGFNTSLTDLRRIEVVRSFGADPYVMKFNNRQDSTLNALARWCNRPQIRESISFSEYTRHREPVIVN